MSRDRRSVLSVGTRPRAAQVWAMVWYWGIDFVCCAGIIGIILWMLAEGTK